MAVAARASAVASRAPVSNPHRRKASAAAALLLLLSGAVTVESRHESPTPPERLPTQGFLENSKAASTNSTRGGFPGEEDSAASVAVKAVVSSATSPVPFGSLLATNQTGATRKTAASHEHQGPSYQTWIAAAVLGSLVVMALTPILTRDGPKAFAIVAIYVMSLVFVKLLVKDAMKLGFTFPYTITALHMGVTAIAASIIDRPRLDEAFRVIPISLANGASLALNNSALVFGSVAFVSMIGCCTIVTTYTLELMKVGRIQSVPRTAGVLIVCAGAMMCIRGEVTLSLLAAGLALAANFFRSLKTVWQHELLMVELPPFRMVAWTGIWACAAATPCAFYIEGARVWAVLTQAGPHLRLSLFASTLIACTLNVAQCFAVKNQGPLLQCALGNLQLVMVLVLGIAWLNETVTMMQWCGVCLLAAGAMATKMTATTEQLECAKKMLNFKGLDSTGKGTVSYGAAETGDHPRKSTA